VDKINVSGYLAVLRSCKHDNDALRATKNTVILLMSLATIDFYRRNHLDGSNGLPSCVLFNYLTKYVGKKRHKSCSLLIPTSVDHYPTSF
jgi:hypothetical protein